MEINVTPNQTLKDFSYGRKFVKGFASRSIAPVMLLEAFVEGGRTYNAYKRGGFTEARERFTEEIVGAAFWFSGVPLFNKLIDKAVGEKIYKLPETSFDTGKDSLRNPVQNYMKKFANELKFKPEKAEKIIAGYKFGKVMTSIVLANCLVGLVLPKVNQGITKYIMKKNSTETQPPSKNEPVPVSKFETKRQSMDEFLNHKNSDRKDVSFGMNPQTLLTLAHNFENNPKYGLLSTDAGVWIGRGACARNAHERTEVLFRDISSSYFYMFNMPVIAAAMNYIQDKNTKRLDPVAAKQVSDHLQEVLKANGGSMKNDAFRTAVLGNPDNKAFLTPSMAKILREKDGVMKLSEFIEQLPDLKKHYPEADIVKIEKLAKGMSELQPKLAGNLMISEKQILDVFTDGAINMPEFLKNVFRCSTSDQNLFTGKISEPAFDKEFSFVSKDTFAKKQKELANYVETVLKKAKGGEITKDLLNKVCRENYAKNALNWGLGFAVSAAFLSTFIPKIQYWITRKATGSNEFPGVADYSNEKKSA